MKKIKKMEADHFYLVRGSSTANSPFFEREEDCKLFLELTDRFLDDYLRVAAFQNNRDGWVMLIATRSAVDIKKAYYRRRARSKKCRKEFEYQEVWQMLSDQFRIFLSAYVKATNYRTGRTGGKVRCRYERFAFDSEEEALWMKDVMKNAYYFQAQPVRRYRPARRLHKLRKKLIQASIYMSCYLLRVPGKLRELGMRCLDLGMFENGVARQLIHRTRLHHFAT